MASMTIDGGSTRCGVPTVASRTHPSRLLKSTKDDDHDHHQECLSGFQRAALVRLWAGGLGR
ncbi:hypothetical protein CO678_43255 [Bradyrhizobium diazoefficiens]|nr:hypothetical protein CO678_43255 [Bradyrhizobium diazoefficiens]